MEAPASINLYEVFYIHRSGGDTTYIYANDMQEAIKKFYNEPYNREEILHTITLVQRYHTKTCNCNL